MMPSFKQRSGVHLISSLAVDNHAGEEESIEVGQRAAEATGQSPTQRHHDVTRVLHFPSEAIPAIHQ